MNSKTKKTHLLKNSHDACGRAGEFAELTSDINKVTCNACLRTVTGHNAGGRPRKTDGRNKVIIVLSDKALSVWEKIPRGDRSSVLSNFLESGESGLIEKLKQP